EAFEGVSGDVHGDGAGDHVGAISAVHRAGVPEESACAAGACGDGAVAQQSAGEVGQFELSQRGNVERAAELVVGIDNLKCPGGNESAEDDVPLAQDIGSSAEN